MHYEADIKTILHSQLNELRELQSNWDGYGAPPIDARCIEAVHHFVDACPIAVIAKPHVVPMSSGHVQLEWQEGPRGLEFEFASPETIRYLKWSPEEGMEEEAEFPASDIGKSLELIAWCTKSPTHV